MQVYIPINTDIFCILCFSGILLLLLLSRMWNVLCHNNLSFIIQFKTFLYYLERPTKTKKKKKTKKMRRINITTKTTNVLDVDGIIFLLLSQYPFIHPSYILYRIDNWRICNHILHKFYTQHTIFRIT